LEVGLRNKTSANSFICTSLTSSFQIWNYLNYKLKISFNCR